MFAPHSAAQLLASRLGWLPELWLHRLANWRKPGRRATIEHEVTEAGNHVYSLEALERFMDDHVGEQALLAEARAAAPVRAGAKPEL